MYTTDLIALTERHCFRPHLYADDTQIYLAHVDRRPFMIRSCVCLHT